LLLEFDELLLLELEELLPAVMKEPGKGDRLPGTVALSTTGATSAARRDASALVPDVTAAWAVPPSMAAAVSVDTVIDRFKMLFMEIAPCLITPLWGAGNVTAAGNANVAPKGELRESLVRSWRDSRRARAFVQLAAY
jgi:hypothetical protein